MANSSSIINKVNNKNNNNFVLKDGVIKEQVALETSTSNNYDEKWAYMLDFNKICLEIASAKGISVEEYKRMTTKRKGPKLPAVSTWVPASSGPMPRTTTGEIGWRSAKHECRLERMGRLHINPKYTIQPPGSDPIANYNYICLG